MGIPRLGNRVPSLREVHIVWILLRALSTNKYEMGEESKNFPCGPRPVADFPFVRDSINETNRESATENRGTL